jgi:1-deoxy-D-xylulose-5-phosphate reductoisomerase
LPAPKSIAVLGATGSIGVNCLKVAAQFPDRFRVEVLAGGWNAAQMAELVQTHRPRLAIMADEPAAEDLKTRLGRHAGGDVVSGREALVEAAALAEVDLVVSAMVGAAGLMPTWAAVKAGKTIALANKETLVMAGELVMAQAAQSGATILPVDSEHSAVFQVLDGRPPSHVRRIILTASGGPFRGRSLEDLQNVTREEALAHPNWSMGAKISIDSATLMNKGLEAIEARWIFDLPMEQIDIQIHPQSIVHSMVEMADGSVLAQLGAPDMRGPIAYAMSYPERLPLDLPPLHLPAGPALTFHEPDYQRFPCLALALKAGRMGGAMPAALNAANEAAVTAFLDQKISYSDIYRVVADVLDNGAPDGWGSAPQSVEQVLAADQKAGNRAQSAIDAIQGETP